MWCESLFSLVNEVLKGLYHQIHSFILLWFKGINYIKWLFLMLHWSFLKTKKCTWSLLVIFGISKNDHLLSTGHFLNFKKWPVSGRKECSFFKTIFLSGLDELTRTFQKWTYGSVQGIWRRWLFFQMWHLKRTWPKDLNLWKNDRVHWSFFMSMSTFEKS